MPQFSETEDTITVGLKALHQGCEMIFSQEIIVLQTSADIEKALGEYCDGSEHGWNLIFMGLKELVETGKVSYTG